MQMRSPTPKAKSENPGEGKPHGTTQVDDGAGLESEQRGMHSTPFKKGFCVCVCTEV